LNGPQRKLDPAMRLTAKLKTTRKYLKDWQKELPRLKKTADNTKLLIQFLDIIEEHRDLEIQEWNFRAILQQHLNTLLDWQRIYWKQRGSIKWVTSGDACTKFFHANATIRHRQNLITTLQDEHGNEIQGHEEKAELLWEEYTKRLGTSQYSHMYFDLQTLLSPSENLEGLEEPFKREEIYLIVQQLPSDKSPGPDGFNGDFLKKCWPTVAEDFYDLCQGFYEGRICLQSINGSHIVLVPKKDNPSKVGDFMPIALLNSSIKLLTKLLSNKAPESHPWHNS
jgi:hypothetical protein